MLFTTVQTPTQPDRPYEIIGFADGLTIRGLSAWRQVFSNIKSIFGAKLGEIEEIFTKLRRETIQKCLDRASEIGADEVINLRFDVSEISKGGNGDGLIVIYVYGTCIKYKTRRTKH